MFIRPSTAADKDAISEMARACYGTLLAGAYAPQVLAAALPHMANVTVGLASCGTYFVAEQDGVIVGAAGWTDGPQGAELRKVAVHPDHIRRGIARALMEHVQASARAAGQAVLHCSASLNAVPFYAALGYVETGRIVIEIGQKDMVFEAVTMHRNVQETAATG